MNETHFAAIVTIVTFTGLFLLSALSAHASPVIINGQSPKGHCTKTIFGTKHRDVLDGSGSRCDETIFGFKGNDILIGGRGRNVLIGGKGRDTLTGGEKNFGTTFVFKRYSSDPRRPDTITDFVDSGPFADQIAINGLCTSGCTFIGTASFSGAAGEVRYAVLEQEDGQTVTRLTADIDGDRKADFAVRLLGSHTLTTANVVFN
jgi:hypothetical protein